MNSAPSYSPHRQPIVGVSSWVQRVQAEISEVAPYPSNVLVCGPTGTGKELIAQEIHNRSSRAEKPFVAVNCAAIAPSLFESLLFGHLKGAFTSADKDTIGYFRAAEGGTLFLDEIGELELSLQAKLLRVLQEGAVTPVGGHDSTEVDVRIVAATNRELLEEAEEGRFRQDLFYRLSVAVIRTCPLVERPEDLQLLSQFLISKVCHGNRMPFKPMSPEAETRLISHNWPGNVRELQNVIERALMRASGPLIEAEDIVFDKKSGPQEPTSEPLSTATNHPTELNQLMRGAVQSLGNWPTMKQFERYLLQMTLERTNYNQTEAARILEMTRGSLYRRVKEHQLERPDTSKSSNLHASNEAVVAVQ